MFASLLLLLLAFTNGLNFEVHEVSTQGRSPPSRSDACMRSFGNYAVIFGGRVGHSILNDTWILRRANGSWMWEEVHSKHRPSSRYAALCAALSEDRFLLLGGHDANTVLNSSLVWVLKTESGQWKWKLLRASSKNLIARAWAVGGVLPQGSVLVSHGKGTSGFRNDAVLLQLENQTVRVQTIIRPSARYAFGVPPAFKEASFTMFGSKLFVSGGCNIRGRCPSSLSWFLDVSTKRWECAPAAPSPQYGAVMTRCPTSKHDLAIVVGGQFGSRQLISRPNVSDISFFRFDPTFQWTQENEVHELGAPRARVGASLVRLEDYFVVVGGTDSRTHKLVNVTHALKFNSNEAITMKAAESASSVSAVDIHALCMFISYGIGFPAGLYIARLFRFFSGSHYWFPMHFGTQIVSYLLAVFGLLAVLFGTPLSRIDHVHGILGLLVSIFVSFQIFATIPGLKPKQGAGRLRQIWEGAHRWIGRIFVTLGVVNSTLGLSIYVVPRWAWTTWFAYAGLLFAGFFAAEVYYCTRRGDEKAAYTPYDSRTETLASQNQNLSTEGNTKASYALDWFPA